MTAHATAPTICREKHHLSRDGVLCGAYTTSCRQTPSHNTQHNNAPDEPNIALRPRSITQLIFNRSPWNKYHREANHSGYISSVKCIFVGFDPCDPGASGDDMFCTSLAWSITMQKVRREMSECTQFSATIPSQGSFQIWMSPTNKL